MVAQILGPATVLTVCTLLYTLFIITITLDMVNPFALNTGSSQPIQ
jgi:hypothetical protein